MPSSGSRSYQRNTIQHAYLDVHQLAHWIVFLWHERLWGLQLSAKTCRRLVFVKKYIFLSALFGWCVHCKHMPCMVWITKFLNTLRTGDADLRFYITTVQDGWYKSAFLTRACFPCTVHLIMQYIEPVSEWSCWRMFIETRPHSELNFRHRASSI